jgi:RimJ/RimL family protein N-acetyltransferase
MSSMAGRWKSPQDSLDWITTSLAVPSSLQFVLSLDLASPLAMEIDTTAVTIVDGAAIIGSIGSMRDGEIGYMLHPAVWGKKIAPEALRAYIPAYFAAVAGAEKLTAHTDTLNTRSRKVLEKTGFTWVMSAPFESVELGTRHEDTWEITRDAVKKWETESS